MSFAEPLIKDLKSKGFDIFVSAIYERGQIQKVFEDKVPEDALSEPRSCTRVYIAVRQNVTDSDSWNNLVEYSVRRDLSVNVFKTSPGAEKTITYYLKGLGYKEITFR